MSIFTNRYKSNDSQFEIKISLEKTNYFPGEQINAIVELSSKNNININNNTLKISYFIKQIEFWQNMPNIKDSNIQIPNGIYDNGKKEYLKDKNNYQEKIILSKEEVINFSLLSKNVFRNSCNITLKIQLPKEMQNSFEWYKENSVFCFSRTILAIHIKDLNLYSYNYIFIQKEQPKIPNEISVQKTIGNDPLIFFWESDNMKFDIYSKIDSVGIYNIFPVEIKIDTSKLKSELISINFSFKRKIKFMINGEQSVFLNTSDFTENLWEENKTLDINEKNHFLKFDIPLVDNEKILNKKKLNFNVNSEANIKKYFSYLMPTYKGNNIQCEYFLKIKPIFSGNKIYVHDFQINVELFHDNNSSSVDAINEINKIFKEENEQIRTENNINEKTNINGGSNYSLPDEEMLKNYYSNKISPY